MTTPFNRQAVSFLEFVWIWDSLQNLTLPEHHKKICRFLSDCRRKKRTQILLMAFRSSGKSTLVGLFCAWVLLTDSDTRILILSADYELAKKMVRNIKRIIERHPLSKQLKPKEKDQWASDRFTVRRQSELRDPSVIARGLSANITGCRADLIICDDVEVPKTCETASKRADLRQKLSELDFVLVPGGTQIYVGTPHTSETIYDTSETGFLKNFETFKLPITNDKGLSAWPERFPPEKIEALRKRAGNLKFLSQMLLKPVRLSESRFNTSLLNWYDASLTYTETNKTAVLKLEAKKLVGGCAWWDPAFGKTDKNDNSVLACVFTDEAGNYFIHDVVYLKVEKAQESAASQCAQVADLLALYHLPVLFLETNGLGKFLPELMRVELKKKRLKCAVIEQTSTRKKELRIIEALDAPLSNGALFAHKRVQKTPFFSELKDWSPEAHMHDDGLDAVSGCLLKLGVRREEQTFLLPTCNKPDWRFGTEPKLLSLDDVIL